eukprot:gene13743-biopygen9554
MGVPGKTVYLAAAAGCGSLGDPRYHEAEQAGWAGLRRTEEHILQSLWKSMEMRVRHSLGSGYNVEGAGWRTHAEVGHNDSQHICLEAPYPDDTGDPFYSIRLLLFYQNPSFNCELNPLQLRFGRRTLRRLLVHAEVRDRRAGLRRPVAGDGAGARALRPLHGGRGAQRRGGGAPPTGAARRL